MNSTYAQNLRLRKIQNRRFDGQDKFSIGKRGEPIPGELDPVTIARRQRRALKRPENLKKRIKSHENEILWHHKKMAEIEEALKEKKNDKLTQEYRSHESSVKLFLSKLMLAQQSLNAILS